MSDADFIEQRLKIVESLSNQLDQLFCEPQPVSAEDQVSVRLELMSLTLACTEEDLFALYSVDFMASVHRAMKVPPSASTSSQKEEEEKKAAEETDDTSKKKPKNKMKIVCIDAKTGKSYLEGPPRALPDFPRKASVFN